MTDKVKEGILKRIHSEVVQNWDKVFRQNPLIIESAYKAMDEYSEISIIEYENWKKSQGIVWCANNAATPAEDLLKLFLQSLNK